MYLFFVSTNLQNIRDPGNIELFIQKLVIKLSKIWFWDPGSGKNLFRIPVQRSKRHRIPDPEHWFTSMTHQEEDNIIENYVSQKMY
jgi:hypothetical protein